MLRRSDPDAVAAPLGFGDTVGEFLSAFVTGLDLRDDRLISRVGMERPLTCPSSSDRAESGHQASPINLSKSPTRHAVMRGPSFTGLG